MTNQKVVFLSRLFYPHVGGVETHLFHVSLNLLKKGYAVTIVTQQYDESLPLHEILNQIEIYRIPLEKTKTKWGIWSWMLSHIQVFISSNIIHAHDVYWWYFPLRIVLFNKPSFITFHGWEGVYPPKKSAIFIRKVSELLSRKNICIGSFIASWYGTKPDVVLFGAHDETIVTKKINYDRQKIAFIGRLDKDNDISMYIEAFVQLKKRIPKLSITFIGDGQFAKEARKVGTVTGFVQDPSTYANDSLWVWSASYLSMIESMAKQHIVCSMYSNALKKEYITTFPKASCIMHDKDISKFVSKFMNVYKDVNVQKKQILEGYTWAKQQTWEKVSDEYIKLWRK